MALKRANKHNSEGVMFVTCVPARPHSSSNTSGEKQPAQTSTGHGRMWKQQKHTSTQVETLVRRSLCGTLHEAYENNSYELWNVSFSTVESVLMAFCSRVFVSQDSRQRAKQRASMTVYPPPRRDEGIWEFLREMIPKIQEAVWIRCPLVTLASLEHPKSSDFVPMSPVVPYRCVESPGLSSWSSSDGQTWIRLQ